MAGVPGFEPGDARIKTWCLTAWRYPNKKEMVATTGFEPVTPTL